MAGALLAAFGAASLFFAYADQKGERLLALDANAVAAKSIVAAICPGGRSIPVVLLGEKPAGAKDTVRDTARNFDERPGFRFGVKGGKVEPDSSCLLVDHDYLGRHKLLAFTPAKRDSKCDAALEKAVAVAKEPWRIEKCWLLGAATEAGDLALVRFKARKKDALASIVLKGATTAFYDMPAKVDALSMWRVDDEGSIGPEAFKIGGVLSGNGQTDIIVDWGAFEGSNLQVLRHKGAKLEPFDVASRYWSPE